MNSNLFWPKMFKILVKITSKLPEKIVYNLISVITFIVFVMLDLLDIIFCLFYRLVDWYMEDKNTNIPCYCGNRGGQGRSVNGDGDDGEIELSETLYDRKNIFRDLGFLNKLITEDGEGRFSNLMKKDGSILKNRWSDCNCESCLSWLKLEDQKLHVVIKEPSQANNEENRGKAVENVIFLHGLFCSSTFWTKTVFPNLSGTGNQNFRLFAVDLLGFGKSPKPRNCLYTMKDHVEVIERSVINQFQLKSFHLVAHSMGCIIALGLAAKYKNSVKSITLVAPPYYISSKEKASHIALNRVAERKLWPPSYFACSIMSWYEHLGRSVCFLICKYHRTWEQLLKLLTRKRDLSFLVTDVTKHTHHSAWHTMHNVICGGAKLMDGYLEAMNSSQIFLTIIRGDKDQTVPMDCISKMKLKVPAAVVKIISNANHKSIILGEKKNFTRDIEDIWSTAAENYK